MRTTGRICFLHMGTGKTGSSAIQHALTSKHAELLQAGLLYPDAARNFHKVLAGSPTAGNGLTINTLLHSGNISGALDVVRRYAGRTEHLVFSCEGFSNVRQETITTFTANLREAGYTPKALIIFRPQADKVVSSYLQQVKASRETAKIPLDEYAEQIAGSRLDRGYNWYLRAKKAEAAFGPENLTVRWYPAVRRRGLEGIPAAAFEWLGAPLLYTGVGSLGSPLVNPTPSREAMIVLKEVNAEGLGGKPFADRFLQIALDRHVTGTKVVLGQASLERIYTATFESNKQLLAEYCPDLDPEQELRVPDRTSAADAALDENALRALREIAAELLGRRGKRLLARDLHAAAPTSMSSHAGSVRPRCIIHVGTHKTGSTSIQSSLSGYEDDRFLYADLGHSGNHSLPIFSLFASRPEQHHIHRARERDPSSVQQYIDEVRYDLESQLARAGTRTLIISGEDISMLRPPDLAKLAEYFRQRVSEIQIVAYVRPPAGLMNSRFQQLVKGGAIQSLDFDRIYQGYQKLFEKLDGVFGRDHVQLWKFDPSTFPDGDVVRDFCARLGIPLPVTRIVRANESLSRPAVALLYCYAKYGAGYSQKKIRGPEAMRLGQIISGDKFRFSPVLLHSVLRAHEADISWMEQRLGQSLHEDIGLERPGDVREETDLLRPDPEAVEQLRRALGRRAPKGVTGKTAVEVAQLVSAWRRRTFDRNQRWYRRFGIARWFGLSDAPKSRPAGALLRRENRRR